MEAVISQEIDYIAWNPEHKKKNGSSLAALKLDVKIIEGTRLVDIFKAVENDRRLKEFIQEYCEVDVDALHKLKPSGHPGLTELVISWRLEEHAAQDNIFAWLDLGSEPAPIASLLLLPIRLNERSPLIGINTMRFTLLDVLDCIYRHLTW